MTKRANKEGNLRQRADGTWEARLTLPDGRRKSLYAKTQAQVVEKLHAAQRAINEGLPPTPEKITLGAYLEQWLGESVKPTVRPYTLQSYQQNVRLHIAKELGHIQLAKLTAPAIQSYMNKKLASGLSARTVQYHHAILRRALAQAEKWDLVPRNVARLVSPPRVKKANITPLSPVEAKALLQAVQADRLSALYTVALAVGLRQGEALGLRWQDINLEASTLTVAVTLQKHDGVLVLTEPKTDKSRRTIKLPDICAEALRDHQLSQDAERILIGSAWQNDWDLVFTNEDGTPLSRSVVTKRFQRTLQTAGIAKRRFHDLRHTCATLLLTQGVPLRVVQEVLGHTLFSTTADIYSHVLPVLMADAAIKMDAALTTA